METARWTNVYRRCKAIITPWRLFAVLALVALFFATRIPAALLPYHQDEYKWAQIADPVYGMRGTIPHPPLGEFLFHATGVALGYEHLRWLPIVWYALLIIVIAAAMTRLYTRRAAFIAVLVLCINTYALIASTQVDIDGALLAFFSAATVFGYLGVTAKRQMQHRLFWWLLVGGVVGGLFTKLSFVVVLAAIGLDLFLRKKISRRAVIVCGAGATILMVGILVARGTALLSYAAQFVGWHTRAWGQILIQCVKALLYVSPLLVGSIAFALRRAREMRVWLLFITLHVLFYVVLFDFSHGALDRYLEFIIVPMAVLSGVMLDEFLPRIARQARACAWRTGAFLAAFVGVFAWWRATGNFFALPLHPKSAFLDALQRGDLGTLIPLTGGSGPLGFYIPLGVVVVAFTCAGAAVTLMLMRRAALQRWGTALLLAITVSYTALATTELVSGAFFGSPSRVLRDTAAFIISHDEIQKVITYNDIGAFELTARGKYFKRLYLNPAFEKTNAEKIASYRGHYLLVRFPELNRADPLVQQIERCPIVYATRNKLVIGEVRDCR